MKTFTKFYIIELQSKIYTYYLDILDKNFDKAVVFVFSY